MNLLRTLLALLICVVLSVPALAQQAPSPPLIVFAAASLQTALSAISAEWRRETGRSVTLSFGSTSALARQIEQGAPADVLASADVDWMAWAEARGLVLREPRRNLAGGGLVLIARHDDPVVLKISPGFPLLAAIGNSRLATANPQSVPLGRYAESALTALGVWRDISPRIAAAENARMALSLVARGEARFGIVYSSDAGQEPRVRIVDTFAADLHPPIVYPFAVTVRSVHPDARAFLEFMVSPAAQRIFAANGFGQAR
jgi:molybdate transport system substrate-binding protein